MTPQAAQAEHPVPHSELHRCAAVACDERVILRRLFCDAHWRLVPRYLQDELREHFRFGQERGKVRASVVWLDAADQAIAAIAEHEAAA